MAYDMTKNQPQSSSGYLHYHCH